jgi:DNA-directed RNA polymerase omega subunit
MARYTSQEAAKQVGGQFRLVLAAVQRARQLDKQDLPRKEGIVISAIRDIEEGRYTWEDYLKNFKADKVTRNTNWRIR